MDTFLVVWNYIRYFIYTSGTTIFILFEIIKQLLQVRQANIPMLNNKNAENSVAMVTLMMEQQTVYI